MQGRPFGAVKYALKSLDVKPEWCEGHVTLARAQREMGEVSLSLESYKKAITLLDEATSLNESEKEEVRQESKELNQLLSVQNCELNKDQKYIEEHGELQGRAHVVEDISALDTQFGDYSSMRETWKEEIKNSVLEMKEREEEETQHGNMEEEYPI